MSRLLFALRTLYTLTLAALAVFLTGTVVPLQAQAPLSGRIIGRVTDANGGAPIDGAQIEVVGTGKRITAQADGRYALEVPAGEVALQVRMIGYAPQSIAGIAVTASGTTVRDIALMGEVVELAELSVTEARRGTVHRALDEQRIATNIVNSVTSEQIRRSPDSDASQAVQRVSGVTVQDGRYVFVRGLGERYTTASLNGARIPSPEPERKVVPLDLFPAALLEGITTSKTFTPDQPGDFSGAQVNLKTREFPAQRMLSISVSGGFNTAATGKQVLQAPTVGQEWLGFAGNARQLPAAVAGIQDFDLPQDQINQIASSFRNAWSARTATGAFNRGFGVTLGGQNPVFGQTIGYLGSLSYSYGQEARADESRAILLATPTGFEPLNASRGTTARRSVLWGGILNLSTWIGENTKLSLNNTYNRTADNEATRYAGHNEELALDLAPYLDVTRLTFTERTVRSNQLAGQHLFGARHVFDWSVTSSGVTRNEPDRSDLAYRTHIDSATGISQPYEWLGTPRTATRTFSELRETSTELGANYRVLLDGSIDPVILKVGGLFRATDRDADSRAYDLTNRSTLTEEDRQQDPETIFDGAYAAAGHLRVRENANGGWYEARDRLTAAYAQLDLPLSSRLRLTGGVRLEAWALDLSSLSPQGASSETNRDNVDVLPALALTYRINEQQNLRFAATQTLSRPEYREVAAVSSFEPIGGTFMFGNPDLQRALIQNYDARWEWYPRPGEVLSVALFGKRFSQPIERVFGNQTGGTVVKFANAKGATNYGVELEARKSLDVVASRLAPFSAFVNATLMQSRITPPDTGVASLTNADRPMVGQAGHVVNAGLSYATLDGGTTATLLYNVVGSRINEAGLLPFPDTYELPRHVLDFSLQFPVLAGTSFKFQAKNLLDAPYRVEQGGVTRLRYTAGRVFSFGATWQP